MTPTSPPRSRRERRCRHYLVMRDYDKQQGWFTVSRTSSLQCSGSGRIGTVSDECMDDGGANGVGDSMEIYCFKNVTRFCLTGEKCPWRDNLPRSDDGKTCSHAGLGIDGSGEAQDHDYMAHAWCKQWQRHRVVQTARPKAQSPSARADPPRDTTPPRRRWSRRRGASGSPARRRRDPTCRTIAASDTARRAASTACGTPSFSATTRGSAPKRTSDDGSSPRAGRAAGRRRQLARPARRS